MPVKIVLREYLEKIKREEKAKPVHQRRPIPTITEMAAASGISRAAFTDFSYDRTMSINRQVVDSIIDQLRACGFDTDLTDILRYIPRDVTNE
jgi:hypothetical protein